MKTNEVILQMHPLSCHLALLLRRAPPGSLGRMQVEVFGVRGDFPGRFTKGIFWFDQGLKPGDSFCFPVLLDDSFCFLSLDFFTTGRLERRWLTSKFCWTCQLIDLFAFYSSSFESAFNYVCILHGTIVFDIFFINPNTKPLFIFLPFPHGHIVLTGGSRPGAPHHRRHHPKTPGGGPVSPSSCRARSAPRHESPGHASVHEQPGCPPVEAGEAEWGWAEVFGWREVTFLEDASHFWFDQGLRPAFSSWFPVLLKRCDKWFIYAIIYHRCRVFLSVYVLAFVAHTSWPCAHPRQNLMKV